MPVTVTGGKADVVVTHDEGPRPDTSLDSLGKLRPRSRKTGTVTAGNASQISDGAAAVVVVSEAVARQSRSPIKARIVASATSGVAPKEIFIAPVTAVQKVLAKAGMTMADIDLIELNEAFAAQSLACMRPLEADHAKTNIHGGAIALGHPIGASGARVLVTLLLRPGRARPEARAGVAVPGRRQRRGHDRRARLIKRPAALAGVYAQQSAGHSSGHNPMSPSARRGAPSVRSKISSRIIRTKSGWLPTVSARNMFSPSSSQVCRASTSRSHRISTWSDRNPIGTMTTSRAPAAATCRSASLTSGSSQG